MDAIEKMYKGVPRAKGRYRCIVGTVGVAKGSNLLIMTRIGVCQCGEIIRTQVFPILFATTVHIPKWELLSLLSINLN